MKKTIPPGVLIIYKGHILNFFAFTLTENQDSVLTDV